MGGELEATLLLLDGLGGGVGADALADGFGGGAAVGEFYAVLGDGGGGLGLALVAAAACEQ